MTTALHALLSLTETGRQEEASRIEYLAVAGPEIAIGGNVHGGCLQVLTAQAAMRALRDLPGADAAATVVLAVSSDYFAAAKAGEMTVRARIRKRGRTVSLVQVDIRQGERTAVRSTVTLGAPDTGPIRHREPHLLDELPPEPPAEYWPLPDRYVERFPLRAVDDLTLDPAYLPAMRGATGPPITRGWVRPRDGADIGDSLFPIFVCDVSPPVVMNLGLFGWAPTVQLTTHVQRAPAPGWLRFCASSLQVGERMFAEDHTVIDGSGVLVAQSRQLALLPSSPA